VKAKTRTSKTAQRGRVLDVVRELLAGDHDEDVLAVVEQLVSRNSKLEMLLAKVREHAKNKSERVSREQPDLFLDKLKAAQQGVLAKASEKLEKTAATQGGREERAKPAKGPWCYRARSLRVGCACSLMAIAEGARGLSRRRWPSTVVRVATHGR
jgi:hypothetical protein